MSVNVLTAIDGDRDGFIEVPILDHNGFRDVLTEQYRRGASDSYIKSDHPIAFKKDDRKHYVTRRPIREDEIRNLINEIRQSGDFENIKNGNPVPFAYHIKGREKGLEHMIFRVQVGSYAGNTGIVMSIRAVNSMPPTVEMVKLEQELVDAHLSARKGISFVCGVTGSGKSTTQAALNREILVSTDAHLLTYEDPIEYIYDYVEDMRTDCTQYLVGQDVKTYAEGAVNCLRENPDYILLGEARDAVTMGAALTLAETGHSVSTTLHAPRGFLVFARVVSMFEPKIQGHMKTRLADMLNYIIFQQLVNDINGNKLALREYVVFDKEARAMLLSAHHNEVSTVLYDIFKTKGQLINDDIQNKYEQGLLDDKTYRELCANYEISEHDLAPVAQ